MFFRGDPFLYGNVYFGIRILRLIFWIYPCGQIIQSGCDKDPVIQARRRSTRRDGASPSKSYRCSAHLDFSGRAAPSRHRSVYAGCPDNCPAGDGKGSVFSFIGAAILEVSERRYLKCTRQTDLVEQ